MSLDQVNLGTVANDGTGDNLRSAGAKINAAIDLLNSFSGTAPTTDAPVTDSVLHGGNASPLATGSNINGGDAIVAPGLGQRGYTIVDYTALAGKYLEVTVNQNNANATGVIEGSTWTAATSNEATAASIAAAFNAPDYGSTLTAQAVGASVFIIPQPNDRTITLDHNGGGNITTTLGRDGVLNIHPWTDGFAQNLATTSGLTYGYKSGLMHFPGGADTDNVHVNAGTVTLLDNSSNIICYITNVGVRVLQSNSLPAPQGLFTIAVVQTAGGEIVGIDDLRYGFYTTSGITTRILSDFSFDQLNTGGLLYVCRGGYLITPAGRFENNGGFVTLTDDATNYIECNVAGQITFNTVGFTPGNYPIAQAVTSAGEITSAIDKRGFVCVPGPGQKHALVAGAAAGDITVADIKSGDRLDEVIQNTAGVWADLTSEFTVSADATINNTDGTNTTGKQLMVRWTKLTA